MIAAQSKIKMSVVDTYSTISKTGFTPAKTPNTQKP